METSMINNQCMPLQHILEECVAVQRHLRERELDLDFIVKHAESLIRHAYLAQEGATYVTTSDKDRERIREAFLSKCAEREPTTN